MPKLHKNYSLKNYNTFGIEAHTRFFFEYSEIEKLAEFLNIENYKSYPKLILGGGSNLLFTKDFEGIVIHPCNKGIKIIQEDEHHIYIKAGAGENWDGFVEFAVAHGYGGIENLSGIPGNIGAVPIQNIGAYGVEVKDVIEKVEAIEISTSTCRMFSNRECAFGYRDSIFKNEFKNRFIIRDVIFKLNKEPVFVTHYGNVEEELEKFNDLNLVNIRKAILNIRACKLPDPIDIGNAGSFFKNPVVPLEKIHDLRTRFPSMVTYRVSATHEKLAAGWLIEQCGWKGKRVGNAGVHENQSLVLVNYKNATGNEILSLAVEIRKSVFEKFGVDIEPEVNII